MLALHSSEGFTLARLRSCLLARGHAARQTGKTTAMRAFAARMRGRGHLAVWATLETSQGVTEIVDAERFPVSVALIGMRDLRDSLTAAKDGAAVNPGSPFNIEVASLTLRNFAHEDVTALYAQHTADTGVDLGLISDDRKGATIANPL